MTAETPAEAVTTSVVASAENTIALERAANFERLLKFGELFSFIAAAVACAITNHQDMAILFAGAAAGLAGTRANTVAVTRGISKVAPIAAAAVAYGLSRALTHVGGG